MKKDNEISKQETIKKSYECYYCDEFALTDNRDDYEKDVIFSRDGKLAYPSLVDLNKLTISPKGKIWEVCMIL
ncbi:MAG: hypothetical protein ACTHKC_06815 [Candidatus Nitrosocosmicus sp.]